MMLCNMKVMAMVMVMIDHSIACPVLFAVLSFPSRFGLDFLGRIPFLVTLSANCNLKPNLSESLAHVVETWLLPDSFSSRIVPRPLVCTLQVRTQREKEWTGRIICPMV